MVVGESGTGLNPSIRVVGFACEVTGFKSIDGGVGAVDVGLDLDEARVLTAEAEVDVEAVAEAAAAAEKLEGLE